MCEVELHGIVSTTCGGIYVKSCMEFLIQKPLLHVVYTDSMSARQLCMRQECDRVGHVSEKILWIQHHLAQGNIELVQVPTVWNLADLGICGMTYVVDGTHVEEEEFQRQDEKFKTSKMIQRALDYEHVHGP